MGLSVPFRNLMTRLCLIRGFIATSDLTIESYSVLSIQQWNLLNNIVSSSAVNLPKDWIFRQEQAPRFASARSPTKPFCAESFQNSNRLRGTAQHACHPPVHRRPLVISDRRFLDAMLQYSKNAAPRMEHAPDLQAPTTVSFTAINGPKPRTPCLAYRFA